MTSDFFSNLKEAEEFWHLPLACGGRRYGTAWFMHINMDNC